MLSIKDRRTMAFHESKPVSTILLPFLPPYEIKTLAKLFLQIQALTTKERKLSVPLDRCKECNLGSHCYTPGKKQIEESYRKIQLLQHH